MSMAPHSQRAIAASLAIAIIIALGGCAPAQPEPAPAPPSAEPEPSPTPSPSEAVALGDFGFTYFGDATIDAADIAGLEAQLGTSVEVPAECPWYPLVATHGSDAETRAFFDPEGVDPGVLFFYTLDFSGDGEMPRNADGVGVGSTEAEVLAAYPDAVVDADFTDVSLGPIRLILVDDPASDSRYAFGLQEGNDVVGLMQWGPNAGGQWAHLCLPL